MPCKLNTAGSLSDPVPDFFSTPAANSSHTDEGRSAEHLLCSALLSSGISCTAFPPSAVLRPLNTHTHTHTNPPTHTHTRGLGRLSTNSTPKFPLFSLPYPPNTQTSLVLTATEINRHTLLACRGLAACSLVLIVLCDATLTGQRGSSLLSPALGTMDQLV